MNVNLTTEIIWGVLIELIQAGELQSMPVPEMDAPRVNDVICFESKEGSLGSDEPDWVYVRVTGVWDYYRRYALSPVNGLKLVVFEKISTLADISIS